MKKLQKRAGQLLIACCCLCLLPVLVQAAPHHGDTYNLIQPDGSFVEVRVFGDEFYQDVETPDGYTLVRDPVTNWICFAEPAADGSYQSSGIVYVPGKTATMVQKKLRMNSIRMNSIRKHNHDVINQYQPPAVGTRSDALPAAGIQPAPPAVSVFSGTYTGLTLLIDFPDKKSSITKQEIENFCNLSRYNGFNNNGSVRDYFSDISDGVLNYQNKVTDFITVTNNFSYYDQNCEMCRVQELVHDALNRLRNTGFDFSALSTKSTSSGTAFAAINIFYAGAPTQGWAKGLWPHSGYLNGSFSANGIKAINYQLTNIGNSLGINTFVHENGHMLLGWPDTYAYDDHDNGIGYYGEGNSKTNPGMRNAWFRYLKGWCKLTDISNAAPGAVFSLAANSNQACYYTNRSDGRQFYVIEALRKTGRNANIPDEGLEIWHVNLDGNNMYSNKPNYISIEQADGKFEIENRINNGGPGDLYHNGDKTQFNDNTTPSAKWPDGSSSGIDINSISAVGDVMTFTFKTGSGNTPTPTPQPTRTATATVRLGDVNSNGTIDIVDALMTAQYYVGLNPQGFNAAAADVNRSGVIDIVDALMIAQYYVGLITGF